MAARRITWVTLVLSLALNACSNQPTTGELLKSSGFRPQLSTLILPFDAYEPSAREQGVIDNAHNILVSRCMAKRGFAYRPKMVNEAGLRVGSSRNDRRYGVRDRKDALRYGFGPPVSRGRKQAVKTVRHQQSSLTVAEKAALYGKGESGAGGCAVEASNDLGGVGSVNDSLVQNLNNQSFFDAEASDAVQHATQDWRGCLQAKGFSGYDTPSDLNNDPRWDGPASRPSSAELQAALADVECKAKSHYVEVFYRAEWQEQLRLINDNAEALQRFKNSLDHLLTLSADVVQGS